MAALSRLREGFVVRSRTIVYESDRVSASLEFVHGSVTATVEGTDRDFLFFVLSLIATMGAERRIEVLGTLEVSPWDATQVLAAVPHFAVSHRGAQLDGVVRAVVRDRTDAPGTRITLWIRPDDLRPLNPLPHAGDLDISYGVREGPTYKWRWYAGRLQPFTFNSQPLLQLECQDFFSGNPTIVEARFNFKVDPADGVYFFGGFADLALVFPKPFDHPDLRRARGILKANEEKSGVAGVFKAIPELARTLEDDLARRIATNFRDSAQRPELSPLLPRALLNAIEVGLRGEPLWVVVGCVENLRVEGILQVGRNVVLAAPDHVRFRLKGRDDAQLCRDWDSASARLVTFVRGAPSEALRSAELALRDAADWLLLAFCDAAWWYLSPNRKSHISVADGRTQHAKMALHPHFHLHTLLGGDANQHRFGHRSATDVLTLDSVLATSLDLRASLLDFLQEGAGRPEQAEARGRVRSATEWIVRSRSSRSAQEEFLCLWIAAEFLVAPGSARASAAAASAGGQGGRARRGRGSGAGLQGEAILGAMQARLTGLVAHGQQDRALWNRRVEEWYRIRCALVHDGGEGTKDLNRQIPLLRHATVAAILLVVEALKGGSTGSVPSILDSCRPPKRATSPPTPPAPTPPSP